MKADGGATGGLNDRLLAGKYRCNLVMSQNYQVQFTSEQQEVSVGMRSRSAQFIDIYILSLLTMITTTSPPLLRGI